MKINYIDVDAFVVSVVIAPVAVIVCDVVSFSVVEVVPAVVSSSWLLTIIGRVKTIVRIKLPFIILSLILLHVTDPSDFTHVWILPYSVMQWILVHKNKQLIMNYMTHFNTYFHLYHIWIFILKLENFQLQKLIVFHVKNISTW